MQKTKCQQHCEALPFLTQTIFKRLMMILTPVSISFTPQITTCKCLIVSELYHMLISRNAQTQCGPFLHVITEGFEHHTLSECELSDSVSSCQGIFSVYRGRSVRQRPGVPLCQVPCCSWSSSFKEETNYCV